MFCDKSLWINIHVDPPGYLGYLDYFNKKFIVKYFRPNFPDLWKRLEEWDENTWRSFRKDYSVRQLAVRFDFEKKWQEAGGNIHGRSFYSALRDELARLGLEVKLCPT